MDSNDTTRHGLLTGYRDGYGEGQQQGSAGRGSIIGHVAERERGWGSQDSFIMAATESLTSAVPSPSPAGEGEAINAPPTYTPPMNLATGAPPPTGSADADAGSPRSRWEGSPTNWNNAVSRMVRAKSSERLAALARPGAASAAGERYGRQQVTSN